MKTVAAPFGHASGSPCRGLPRCGCLFCAPKGPTTRVPAYVSCVGDGSPALRHTGISSRRGEGLPGYEAVLFVRAMVEHPAGYNPLLAQCAQGAVVAFEVIQHSRHPGRI